MERCPVCGYLDRDNPPVDSAICACCETQFGYHDSGHTHAELRARWIAQGCKWSHPRIPAPRGWSAARQLAEAGFNEPVPA